LFSQRVSSASMRIVSRGMVPGKPERLRVHARAVSHA
jgi:hypothetical protein